jgi:hypothetical protein
MGGKIDELLTIARDTNGRLARLEQWAQDREHRCDNHSAVLKEHNDKIQSLTNWKNWLAGAWAAGAAIAGLIVGHKVTK